jgi:HK97 family phage portal protein
MWDRFLNTLRSSWSGPLHSNSPELARLFAAPSASAGVAVNEHTALNCSAVWSAVSIIAGDVASLPLILYKREGEGKKRFTGHPLYRILHDEPNPEMSAIVFRETLQAHLLTWGNAYAEIERSQDGRVKYLWPLTPDRVAPFRDERTLRLKYRVASTTGPDIIFSSDDILHVPGLGYDGMAGYSVIAKARESIGLGMATERFGGTFFGNGSTFGGALVHPKGLSDKARKNLTDSLEARHQGVDRAHRFLVLEEGMTYERFGIPPNDAQFLETRKFQITEIARWFQIPPHKLGDLERATFSNIEHQSLDYYKSCLRKWLVRWEQEINRKLISPSERNIQFAEHNLEGLLRGDQKSRFDAYAVGRQWGWLTANNILRLENMDPLGPEGDMTLVPHNMMPASRVNEIVDAQVSPDTPAPDGGAVDRSAEVAALEQRLTAAEQSLADAETAADQARGKLIAAEAMGTATADELAVRRDAEAQLRAHADQLALLVSDIRTERDTAVEAREALTDVLETERAARADAEAGTAAALSAAEQAKLAQVDAEAAAHAARDAAESARAEQVAAEQRAAEAQAGADAALTNKDAAETARLDAERQVEEARARAEQAEAERIRLEQVSQDAAAQVEATRAELERLTAQLAEATAERQAEADARAEAERQATEATEQARNAAEFVAGLEQELFEARNGHASVETRSAEVEQARAALEAQLQAQKAAEQARLVNVIAAHRGIFVDAMSRLIRRETDRARKAHGSPDKLRHWAETFYPLHADICQSTLLPAMRAHLAWMQSDADPGEATKALVQQYIAESKRQLSIVADSDDYATALEQTLQCWDAERADQIADLILKAEIDHVRSL